MLARYVLADLLRNPRRTVSTMVGVVLGVGLFCGVLFFVDGLSASMTQRAVAPLPIDMQRIVTQRAAAAFELSQSFDTNSVGAGEQARIDLELTNRSETAANEVTVRSVPAAGLVFVPGSAELDGEAIAGISDNPFAQGPARAGYNLGTVEPGRTHHLSYRVEAPQGAVALDDSIVASTYSTREAVNPIAANQPPLVGLDELARLITRQPGVAHASPLSIADLGTDSLHTEVRSTTGPTKIFGFDTGYAEGDDTIDIVEGALTTDGAVLSAEAARALDATIGDTVTVDLPDGTTTALAVSGVADLSRSRSLYSSRRGGDLETFIYIRNAIVVSPAAFAEIIFPAFERAAAETTDRLKSPPIREIDITLQRHLLDADPATAVTQTERIGAQVTAVAAHQDYLLDNISNTLTVAAADAEVAKRLFVFLGVPGGLLAAVLAAYAGNVLAEAQRREHATLRIRGASRRHLLRMLGVRTALLTATGSIMGLTVGYLTAAAILGRESLDRASTASLVASAVIGTLGGFVATGAGLYVTGRRSIDREINEDRAQLSSRPPLWRRARLDFVGLGLIVAGTAWALQANAFDGAAGSVYFGRAVELNLALLVLPVAAWITGSLFAARLIGYTLHRTRPASSPRLGRVGPALYRRSIGRRPWAISNGAIVASLIVALATSLAAFTASYDAAKTDDARYANGADIRVTPSPTANRTYAASSAPTFETPHAAQASPVIYGLSNVIMRSDRTSDPANLAAVDPASYPTIAPIDTGTARDVHALTANPGTILVSADMARYLKVVPGDTIHVLLARATPEQVDVELTIAGLFGRLPGFPDGADAIIDIAIHTAEVPTKAPDFFLAATTDQRPETLQAAVDELRAGPAADHIQIDTRVTTLDRDQSSLAALNIAGLVDLDSTFALAMATVAIAIFVFGLLLQRRREYVTLRAQGLEPRMIRLLIGAEAATVAATGTLAGIIVGTAMGYYFVTVLRPLFVLDPSYHVPVMAAALPGALILAATVASSLFGSRLVNTLQPTELLRDE
jgi:putative ABC transport system permease protein